MANLSGNLSGLVSPKVKDDKRKQLLPEKESSKPKQGSGAKIGRKTIRKSDEPYIATRLLLPESLKEQLDLFCIKEKVKGKNEFLVEAIRKHLSSHS